MRRLPPLHALRAFEAAARHLHFARAAAELHLTPTAISHQVRQLEDTLQVQLFHRHPRPLRLSPEGEALYPVLRDSLDRIATTVADLSPETPERPLTVSVTVAFASRWLMPRLPRLRAETGLDLAIEADDRPADLHGGEVDFAIRYATAPESSAAWLPLFEDRLVPVCAPELLAQQRPVMAPRDVLRLPLIQYRWRLRTESEPTWRYWGTLAGEPASSVHVSQHFSEEVHAIDAAMAAQGVVLASDVLVADELATGQLVKMSDISLPGRRYWAVCLKTNLRYADVLRFASWARGDE